MSTIIQCQGVSQAFGSKKVLQQLDFTLQQGEVAALIGPNGAGKTTLFSILCGYLKADSGSVLLFGHKPGSAALFAKVAALPQDAQFDPAFSIGEQLDFYGRLQGLSRKAAHEETLRVLALVDLADQVQQKAAALSHGMRKRAAIAQAFIGSPQLILMDEPTAGMAPQERNDLMALTKDLVVQRGMAVLFTEHSMDVVFAYADRMIVLARGRLIAEGKPLELRDHPKVQEVYFGTGKTFEKKAAANAEAA